MQNIRTCRMPLKKTKKIASFFLSAIVMAGQPTPLTYPPPRNKGLIAGLIKGNQWIFSQALIWIHNLEMELQNSGSCRMQFVNLWRCKWNVWSLGAQLQHLKSYMLKKSRFLSSYSWDRMTSQMLSMLVSDNFRGFFDATRCLLHNQVVISIVSIWKSPKSSQNLWAPPIYRLRQVCWVCAGALDFETHILATLSNWCLVMSKGWPYSLLNEEQRVAIEWFAPASC